jgi:hypothetical protein
MKALFKITARFILMITMVSLFLKTRGYTAGDTFFLFDSKKVMNDSGFRECFSKELHERAVVIGEGAFFYW